MGNKVTLPDFPALPEIPLLDEDDIGRRIGHVAEVIGERAGKRLGSAVGGVVSFGIGIANDILELPSELTKK